MKEKMTIHEALSELKILDARINGAIGSANFVTANKHCNTKIQGKSIQDYSQEALDDYKSIMSLINRRAAIKKAVSRSNAWTTVEIAGETYYVAEAIEMKNHGLEYPSMLKRVLSSQLEGARRLADRENNSLEGKADNYVASTFSGADKKNMSDEMKKAREDYMTAQTMELIDPLGAAKLTKELEEKTSAFMSKVDSALSVSNALTTIEIEYETL